MSGAAIDVRNLRVVRGGVTALDDVSLVVPRGTVTGLIGPSGCGKTTLMRCIVGTQIVRSGSVTVLGRAAGSRALRARVAYAAQERGIYPDLTVAENVAYFAALNGRRATDVDATLDSVDLRECRARRCGDLSGGEQARTSLACALVGKPDLLVLDEPTVGLDPVLRVRLWAQFADLAHNGTTLLVSSHVMEEAGHCDRLLLLRDGTLLADTTPAELRETTGEASLERAFLALIRHRQGHSPDG